MQAMFGLYQLLISNRLYHACTDRFFNVLDTKFILFVSCIDLPVVSISSNDTDTVPEGSVLSINCTVIDENVHHDPDYSIEWSVINSDTQENYTNLNIHGDNGEILYLSAKSDVDVSCNVVGKIKDMDLRNASSSMHISVARKFPIMYLTSVNLTLTTCNSKFC